MGITRSRRLYENPATTDKGKAPATEEETRPRTLPTPFKKVTEEEAEAFMKVIKASEYKVVEQIAKSPAHISLLALLLNSEPHKEALMRVLTALPPEGCAHFWALHIVCKCNNHIVGRVMIDNGSALNVCPVTTLKQMNVDLNRIRPSKTAVRAFDGSRREKVKFIVEEKIITVKGEEDYAIYKETVVPYISVRDDENLPFHSFETVSVIRDYGKIGPSRAVRMIGKVIKELPPPSSVREVRGFLGRLNCIARFNANLTDKCQPLFRLLRKNAAIEWDEECQKAFDTIKAYLVQPSVLVPPTPGRPLVLYLTVRRQSLGCMLGREEESTHTERTI
ncbi:hypothetical protein CRG98_006876 [Punica granatum]|uniref:Reverse transcriptase/retrotransposon-derived protein RNase H-like domain-containing protein n=1 Tax=Punica granatum TaxID=22663 RepID=A0A2I0KW85_PUNGR|nr:hypothetical protein CRG98_006876 [Punica granatum]